MALIKSRYLRLYIQEETGVNLLMLAAGLGKADYVHALLNAGADRSRHTPREKMLPLYFAAWTENWQCVQMLLGGGPGPEHLRVEISLKKQYASVIKDGVTVFTTKVSTAATASARSRAITSSPTKTATTARRFTNARCLTSCG
jgi:hypothetical protein